MSNYKLNLALCEKEIRKLKAGDAVLLSGTIFTARDEAHKRILSSGSLPFNLNGFAVYHCGPIMKKTKGRWKSVAAGPTTSARMEKYTPKLIGNFGVRAIIGKGGMGKNTLEACRKHGCIYLHAVGGAAALLAKCIKKVKNVYFLNEFGMPEAVWELEVEGFPAIVTMDSHGTSLHSEILEKSGKKMKEI